MARSRNFGRRPLPLGSTIWLALADLARRSSIDLGNSQMRHTPFQGERAMGYGLSGLFKSSGRAKNIDD